MRSLFKLLRESYLWIVLTPWLVGGLGTASNQLVFFVNHDKFPVMLNPAKTAEFHLGKYKEYQEAVDNGELEAAKVIAYEDEQGMLDDIHCLMTDQTHLNFLADIIDFHSKTESFGDLFLEASEWMNGFALYLWAGLLIKKFHDAEKAQA